MPPRRRDPVTGEELLTPREELFVEHVATGKSLSQAGLAAGYSPNSARSVAPETLQNPVVKKALAQRRASLMVSPRATFAQAVNRLTRVLEGDIADVFPDEPILQRAKANGTSLLIRKFRRLPAQREGQEDGIDLELYSVHEAAALLAKILGWEKEPERNPAEVAREDAWRVLELLAASAVGDSEEARFARAKVLLAAKFPALAAALDSESPPAQQLVGAAE